jgi:hypothetical protein
MCNLGLPDLTLRAFRNHVIPERLYKPFGGVTYPVQFNWCHCAPILSEDLRSVVIVSLQHWWRDLAVRSKWLPQQEYSE